MTITQMLGQSATLTLLGMGVVFSFIIILIICLSILHKILTALKLDKEPVNTAVSTSAVPAAAQNNAVIAAIAAAVREKQSN